MLLLQAAFPFFGAEARPAATLSIQNTPRHDKVIMLIVDTLTVEELTGGAMPHVHAVAGHGAVGLMSTRTGGPHTPAAAHLTLGAGARARAGPLSGLVLDGDERFLGRPAAAIFAALAGEPAGEAAAFFLGGAQLQELDGGAGGGFAPGALAGALAAAGVQTAAVGNADAFAPGAAPPWPAHGHAGGFVHPRRHGALIAMDETGRIRHGTVGPGTLLDDEAWPFGLRTDYDALWEALAEALDAADFIVVELGDLARLDAYADWLTPERLRGLRRETLRRMDDFVGRLRTWPGAAGALLLLVSPSPPAAASRQGLLLAPILVAPLSGAAENQRAGETEPTAAHADAARRPAASAGSGPRLVTSATTRRAGIVTNLDVAPTVLAALGGDATSFAGASITSVPVAAAAKDAPYGAPVSDDAWAAVRHIYERTVQTNRLRGPVVRGFILFCIVVFLGWAGWMAYAAVSGAPGPESRAALWRWVLLLLSSAPLAILTLPMVIQALPLSMPASPSPIPDLPLARLSGDATATLALGALAAAAATIAYAAFPRRPADAFVALSLITAAVLVLDVAAGARLIKNSILGYDPIVAARFYGIGNEYMGVLIGTTLIGTTGLLDRFSGRPAAVRAWHPAVTLAYAAVIFILASPGLGANAGGTVAAVAGFGTTLLLLSGRRWSWRTIPLLAGAAALVLGAAAVIDLALPGGPPSHFGRTLAAFLDRGWAPVAAVAARKAAMNVALLRWTIWAQVFVVSLAITAVALYRPGLAVRRADEAHPHLLNGIRGAAAGALAALAANDSGVVAAATLMIPVTAALMYILLLRRQAAA